MRQAGKELHAYSEGWLLRVVFRFISGIPVCTQIDMRRKAVLRKFKSVQNAVRRSLKWSKLGHTQTRHEYVYKRAQSSPHFLKEYVKWITTNFNTVCVRCHTGKNLYENNFKPSLTSADLDIIMEHHNNEISSIALARDS